MRSMKLEARFYSDSNKIFSVAGTEASLSDKALEASEIISDGMSETQISALCASVPSDKISCVRIPWALVGQDEESYNESFLATLRDFLKALEDQNKYVFIAPVCEDAVQNLSAAEKEALTASFKHCARRVKDAASVVGFAVPSEADAAFFIEELSAKHKHYVFFSKDTNLLAADPKLVRY